MLALYGANANPSSGLVLYKPYNGRPAARPGLKLPIYPTSITMGSTKASCWSITINNPTQEDYAEIEALKAQPWCKSWEGQLERGSEGTEHIQAMLRTERCRWGRVKTALTRAHVEAAKNQVALAQYVHKTDTRVAEMPTTASRFMNIQQFYSQLAPFLVNKIAEDLHESADDIRRVLRGSTMIREHSDRVAEWKKQYKVLDLVRECAGVLIEQGTCGLEYIVTNPATKTMFKEFFWNIIMREICK